MADARGERAHVSRRAVLGASIAGVVGLLAGCEGGGVRAGRGSTTAVPVPSRSARPAPTVAPASSTAPSTEPMVVQTGLARMLADGCRVLRGRNVGVLTNPTGVTASLESIVDVLHATRGVELRAVFGPEHGFRGTAPAGRSEPTTTDPRTGLTVYDLYGLTSGRWPASRPSGSRHDRLRHPGRRRPVLHLVWTLFDVMTAAAATGRRVVVLDRRTRSAVRRVAGPVLRPELETAVGRAPIPQQHGMRSASRPPCSRPNSSPAAGGSTCRWCR